MKIKVVKFFLFVYFPISYFMNLWKLVVAYVDGREFDLWVHVFGLLPPINCLTCWL